MADKDALRAAVFKAVEDYCAADFGYSFEFNLPVSKVVGDRMFLTIIVSSGAAS